MKRLLKYWWAAVLIFGLPLLLYAAGWKATYTELAATPATDDAILILDLSDTTMAATGTTKWISYTNFFDNDLVDIAALACTDGQIMVRNASNDWVCGAAPASSVDSLTEDTIDDGYLDKAAIALAAKSVSQAVSLGDNGELTPTAGYMQIDVALTCTADDADIVMLETGAIEGAEVVIKNVAANTCRFNDSAGVSELKTTQISLELDDYLVLKYYVNAWYEISRSQASLSLASINSAVPFTDGATGGAYIKLLEDSDNGTDYSQIKGADNAGAFPSFTFSGSQGAEDLTVTATADTWTWSSSTGVTAMSLGSLNLATTGTISGAIPIVTDNNGLNLTAAQCYGTLHVATGTGTWLLPAAVAGMSLCIVSTTAANIIVDCDAGDHFVYEGTAESNGEALDSDDAAGEFICFVAIDADTWYTLGHTAGWTGE